MESAATSQLVPTAGDCGFRIVPPGSNRGTRHRPIPIDRVWEVPREQPADLPVVAAAAAVDLHLYRYHRPQNRGEIPYHQSPRPE